MCPLALLLHLGDRMLDQREDAVQIDGDRAMPLLVGHAVDGRIFGRPDAVIGDQNVEASEGRDRRRHQLLRRCRGRKIALHGTAIRLRHIRVPDAPPALSPTDS